MPPIIKMRVLSPFPLPDASHDSDAELPRLGYLIRKVVLLGFGEGSALLPDTAIGVLELAQDLERVVRVALDVLFCCGEQC